MMSNLSCSQSTEILNPPLLQGVEAESLCARLSRLASWALIQEAELTPKPGLVDLRGSGSHTDMDIQTLRRSVAALEPWFLKMAQAARNGSLDTRLRQRLGQLGRDADLHMLAAAGGVNTHRGAIWSLGLLLSAVALNPCSRDHQQTCLGAALLARLPDPHLTGNYVSHGEAVRSAYGYGGAREEAEAAFPHVRFYAMPALQTARRNGLSETEARLEALLALMSTVNDTCVVFRAGPKGLLCLKEMAAQVLKAGGLKEPAGRKRFKRLDEWVQESRISPGGSADLLAATIFLDALIKDSRR